MKLSNKLTYIVLKALSFCIKISPQWIKNLLTKLLYWILFYFIPIRKKQVFDNLKLAFPDETPKWHTRIAKNCYQFFIHQAMQFFAFPKSFLSANINIVGQDRLDSTIKKKTGIIFVSGHFGAWEFLAAWIGQNQYLITAVAVKQKNRGSDKFFIEQRSMFGMKHIYRRSSLDNMYKVLEKKEILGLVSDQDAKKRGVFVDYFNRKTSTPKGAARFHLETDTPIIFTVCYQNMANDYTIEFIPIKLGSDATIESITQAYTTVLEKYVRKYPEQYFWFHRRWKTKFELSNPE